ncbi:MAG: hypothetical protein QXN15_10085 [Candidatus Jordarchaeales archaeon]
MSKCFSGVLEVDLEEAIRVVARRMSKRGSELRGNVPTIGLVDRIMSEVGCEDHEDFLGRLLENPKEFYELALLRLKSSVADSFLSLLFTDVFSRFGLGELGPVFLEAMKTGDKIKVKEIFLKVAEAVKEVEEKERGSKLLSKC